MLTARSVEFIGKHKFAKAALDKAFEIFVLYVAALEILSRIIIYIFQAALVLQKTI